MYSRRGGLGITAPPGPKPGTIQDPAATLGWRKVYPGDVVTTPAPTGKPAYQMQTAVVAQPVVDGGIRPVAPSPSPPPAVPSQPTYAPMPTTTTTPAPTSPTAVAPPGTILSEPATLTTNPATGQPWGSPYNAPLVSQPPFAPQAQLLLQPSGGGVALPGVAAPDGSVTPVAPAQAGFDAKTIAIAVGGAVLLTMLLGKRRR
ncbi:MAG TPA: hypothetical protein VMF63_03480 [Opitutaceae bacterium]|nr:hypothetical protein [Opitutaceae bacterium]